MSNNKIDTVELENIPTNAFALELLRDELIPDLTGKETNRILYWAGKSLARRFPLESLDDIIHFFEKACWGTLTITEQKRRELHFELSSPLITFRHQTKKETTYQLEAGFLAQQIQQQRKTITETYEEPKKRSDKVQFIVQWDQRDIIDETATNE